MGLQERAQRGSISLCQKVFFGLSARASVILPITNGGALLSGIYSSLATHVFMASSTALDRSPFFPPNLSMVLNLSFFSSSSESSTLILPITLPTISFMHDSHVLDVLPISKLPYANYRSHFCYHCTSILFAYSPKLLGTYQLIKISV